MVHAKTIPVRIILESVLLSEEEAFPLQRKFQSKQSITSLEILELDLPSKNRVDTLLRYEFLREKNLRGLACDFAEHTLHIFEKQVKENSYLRRCFACARMYLQGSADLKELQLTIKKSIPIVWKLEGTPLISAFEAGLSVTFLDYKDASEMARIVAAHSQRAAHRYAWENRKSNYQPLVGREIEAAWQLKRIADVLTK